MPRRLILASASSARLRLLVGAGFAPEVVVSGIDEDGVEGAPAAVALELATRKAHAVASQPGASGALVVGCDSVLDVDGKIHGKPQSADEATERLRRLRGKPAVLRTGHCVVDTATGSAVRDVASTTVWFGDYDDDELEAYVATGEPLRVAGAFTLDGYAAPFIGGVEGDPSNVIGLSLPLFRTLLGDLGIKVYELWTR